MERAAEPAARRPDSGPPPGDALDAGSGEGADAIWLASRGWAVTAVDVSAVALDRAAAHAEAEGVHVNWQREDLLTWDPGPGRFDLVMAQFMHLPNPSCSRCTAGWPPPCARAARC